MRSHKISMLIALFAGMAAGYSALNASCCDSSKKFEPTWDSLEHVNNEPEWFKDAKFGIYAHWGPNSVSFKHMDPKGKLWLAGWHGMFMYHDEGRLDWRTGKPPKKDGKYDTSPTANHLYHVENFGDPKEFGYDSIIREFDPSGFDAVEWAELFEVSGARFAGPVAMHHDNFAMWDAKSTRWNSMNYGGIDPSADLKREIEKRGMKFMGSFHHAFTWMYFAQAHQRGTVKKEDWDLFTEPHTMADKEPSERFYKEWWAKLKEFIDVYEPDLIWFDWWLENMSEECRKEFLAYYYNKGQEWGKDVAIAYKETTFPEHTAIRDYERGRPNQPKKDFWLTDTSPGAWFFRPNAKFVSSNELVDILVDIVSKNGCMLLNVPPNPDGTIPEEMKQLLKDIGAWLDVNGEAIYDTRTWTIFGEGPTRLPAGGHKVEKHKIVYQESDIRFTRPKDTDSVFYAIVMDAPKGDVVIKSLSTAIGLLNLPIEKIDLLGSDQEIKWKRTDEGLVIEKPSNLPTDYAHAFKITLEGYSELDIAGGGQDE